MITQLEIAIQSTYDTNTGSGPIASALNWECATRLNKVGAFSFEMPLADPTRSLLVAKRYVRCYGIVNDTWTELGKPGIIERISRSIDGEGIPTGMIRVEGTDLFGELADILIHELDIIDTSTRIPDSVQYYDGTATAYLNMAAAYDNNDATSVEIPADDEDWFYFGDADPWDITTFDLGANLNSDSNNFRVEYSQGASAWGSGTILSDTTKVDNASFAQDGAIRWERQEDWATDTVNSIADMYWLRFRYAEDMSGDVTVIEIDITQETPTTTALTKWQEYIDVDGNTPISTLGWDFEATHTEAQNTVFLKLREVSAFKALAMIAEQTGENFRLGSGREIEWLQDDKTASGIVATNAIDSAAGASATTNCWITSFRQSSDAYELVGRVYPRGGGRGATRVNLLECTRTAAGGYTLSKALNYLQKDSVESDYGRPIERPKYWPELMSPNAANAKDINVANALYDLTYQYLQRHCIPQTAYDVEVVKLDSAVAVGTTLQVAYWQTVDGSAIMDVGVDGTPIHLWVLESTQRVDNKGLRSVAMKIATTDAWPTSAGDKMQEVVYQVLAIQATDGPMSAASLTVGSAEDLLASLDLSAYTKHASDETITGVWTHDTKLNIGGPAATGVTQGLTIDQEGYGGFAMALQSDSVAHGMTAIAETDTYAVLYRLNVDSGGAHLIGLADGDGAVLAAAKISGYLGQNADTTKSVAGRAIVEAWGALADGTGFGAVNADAGMFGVRAHRGSWETVWLVDEDGDSWQDGDIGLEDGAVVGIIGNEIITFNAAGTIAITGADLSLDNDLLLADGAIIGITGNEIITFQAAGTIDFTGADVTMSNDLTVTNDIILLDGAIVGIAGNEVITFNAAGTIAITGADVLLGSEDGLGKLNFDEGTTIANGIVWGSDANKVTLYRSADDMLKTDDSLTVALGLSVSGDITAGANVYFGTTYSDVSPRPLTAGNKMYEIFSDNRGSAYAEIVFYGNDGVLGTVQTTATEIHFRTQGSTYGPDGHPLDTHLKLLGQGNLIPGANKTQDFGLSGTAWDDCWADDFQNEPDYYYMDSRTDRTGKIVSVDDLAVIRNIRPSGEWDTRTGLPLIDDASLPDWIFTRDKKTGKTLYDPDGQPWLSLKMTTSLSWGAIRQLDGYRQDAHAEREAIRARLYNIERRG